MIADIGTVDAASTLSIAQYKYPAPVDLRDVGMYCVLLKFAMKDVQEIAHMMMRPCCTRAGKTVIERMSGQRKSEVKVVGLEKVCSRKLVPGKLGLHFVSELQ